MAGQPRPTQLALLYRAPGESAGASRRLVRCAHEADSIATSELVELLRRDGVDVGALSSIRVWDVVFEGWQRLVEPSQPLDGRIITQGGELTRVLELLLEYHAPLAPQPPSLAAHAEMCAPMPPQPAPTTTAGRSRRSRPLRPQPTLARAAPGCALPPPAPARAAPAARRPVSSGGAGVVLCRWPRAPHSL